MDGGPLRRNRRHGAGGAAAGATALATPAGARRRGHVERHHLPAYARDRQPVGARPPRDGGGVRGCRPPRRRRPPPVVDGLHVGRPATDVADHAHPAARADNGGRLGRARR